MAEVEMKVDQGTVLVILPVQGLLDWRLSVFLGGQPVHNRGVY